MSYAKSVKNVGTFQSRWHTQRINRRLDDRDNAMKDAFKLLEAKSSDYFPVINSTTLVLNSASSTTGTFSGTSFSSSDVAKSEGDVVTDGDACTVTVHLPGDVEFTLTLDMDAGGDSWTPTFTAGVLTAATLAVNGTDVTALTAAVAATQAAHIISVTAGTGGDVVADQEVSITGGSSQGDYEVSIGGVAYWPYNSTLVNVNTDPSHATAYGITGSMSATSLAVKAPSGLTQHSTMGVRITLDGVLTEMWLKVI